MEKLASADDIEAQHNGTPSLSSLQILGLLAIHMPVVRLLWMMVKPLLAVKITCAGQL